MPHGCLRSFQLEAAAFFPFGSGSWARTTAASMSTQPKYSFMLIWSWRMTAHARVANTDSRLKSRDTTVGSESFWARICKV